MKNKILISVLIIIIIVLGFLLLYKNSRKINTPGFVSGIPQISQENNLTNELSIYNALSANYSVNYPSSWIILPKVKSGDQDIFQIKNNPSAVLPGANSEMRSIDSVITIIASPEKDHLTIDEIIKATKYGIPSSEINTRLAKVSTMNIDGKSLRVLRMNNATGDGYSFVYNGKAYNVNIMSGSETQYGLDHKVFTDLVSSLKFIN